MTDALAALLQDWVDLVLPVARGRLDLLSMQAVTLGLLEALLVGVATKRPRQTLESLNSFYRARKY